MRAKSAASVLRTTARNPITLSRVVVPQSPSGVTFRKYQSQPLRGQSRHVHSVIFPPVFELPFPSIFSDMAPVNPAPVDTKAVESHRPIVISGPSGAGKSTILKRLFDEYPDKFGFSISHTTRAPRGSEKHGTEYYFVTKEEFLDLVSKKGFIEHAQFGSNHYGTSIKAVNDIAEKGRICILDIEMEVWSLRSSVLNRL